MSDADDIRYRINEPDVTAESFDDEVIVINLANGRYHSLRGSATWLWQALAAGVGRRQAIERLLTAADTGPESAAQAAAVIDRLVSEQLMVAVPDSVAGDSRALNPPAGFLTPLIETFTDMENLLTIDPIHEVDVQGWPHTSDPA